MLEKKYLQNSFTELVIELKIHLFVLVCQPCHLILWPVSFSDMSRVLSPVPAKWKKGLFEVADQGTIFLDDIDDVPLNIQTKLLRVLESREIMRVGGTKPIKVDIRLISASKIDLKELIRPDHQNISPLPYLSNYNQGPSIAHKPRHF